MIKVIDFLRFNSPITDDVVCGLEAFDLNQTVGSEVTIAHAGIQFMDEDVVLSVIHIQDHDMGYNITVLKDSRPKATEDRCDLSVAMSFLP